MHANVPRPVSILVPEPSSMFFFELARRKRMPATHLTAASKTISIPQLLGVCTNVFQSIISCRNSAPCSHSINNVPQLNGLQQTPACFTRSNKLHALSELSCWDK